MAPVMYTELGARFRNLKSTQVPKYCKNTDIVSVVETVLDEPAGFRAESGMETMHHAEQRSRFLEILNRKCGRGGAGAWNCEFR